MCLAFLHSTQHGAGVAQPDEVIAWTAVQLRDPAAAAAGSLRSLPLYNPPVTAAPGAPRFPVAGAASLQFHVYETQCRPGVPPVATCACFD